MIDDLFGELVKWANKPRWSGSGFTRVVWELADLPGHPARKIADQHKAALEQSLADLLASAGVASPAQRGREIAIILEGAMSLILIHRDTAYAAAAARAAKHLIKSK